MENDKITIDVISDIACPWCYVGKRRLEAAIDKWEGAPVEVTWHPYQLDPTMSMEGKGRDTYLTEKFGSVEKMSEMTNHLTAAGKELGIDFNFGEDWLAYNTLHLHQLLHAAGQEGFKTALKERFLKAYFETLEPLNDINVLHKILAEFNWSPGKVDQIIASEELAKGIQEQIKQAQKAGVTSVPFFIVNNKYAISGAQPESVFLETFGKLAPLQNIVEGESCDSETSEC